MKGVYEKLKPQPNYTQIWDVSLVLSYLATLTPNSSLSLKNLTLKLVMLLLLVSSQRGQAIHSLSLQGMTMDCKIVFYYPWYDLIWIFMSLPSTRAHEN